MLNTVHLEDHGLLAEELVLSLLKSSTELIRDGEALDNSNLAVLNSDGEGVDDVLGDTVPALADDTHGNPVTLGGTVEPGVHVVGGGVGSRHGGRLLSSSKDGSTTGLDGGDEGGLDPLSIDGVNDLSTVDFDVGEVGNHGVRVVAPDGHLLDLTSGDAELVSDLREGSVVVEASETREVLLGDGGSVLLHDQAVSVGRVGNNENLAVLLAVNLKSLTSSNKDLGVLVEKILAVHARETRETTDHEGNGDTSESLVHIGSDGNGLEKGVSTILNLHDNTLKGVDRLSNIKKNKLNHGVGTANLATASKGDEGITDLTSSTSNKNTLGSRHFLDHCKHVELKEDRKVELDLDLIDGNTGKDCDQARSTWKTPLKVTIMLIGFFSFQ